MTDALENIRRAAAAVDAAQRDLREAVRMADVDNISDLAEAAGVTRQTIYRWRRATGGGIGSPMRAMDDALETLLAMGTGPADMLAGGLRTRDRQAKARRVLLGAKNVSPEAQRGGEERAIIQLGIEAAHRILDGAARTRPADDWPGDEEDAG